MTLTLKDSLSTVPFGDGTAAAKGGSAVRVMSHLQYVSCDDRQYELNYRTMCGVTVSMSAFLACHQCYCAGLSLAWGLGSLGCSMWHFVKLATRGFLRVHQFPPLLHWLNGSANKIKLK